MKMEKILVAHDGSAYGERALDFAIDLAQHHKAALTILHVQSDLGRSKIPPELERFEQVEHIYMTEREILRGNAEQILQDAVNAARRAGVENVEGERQEGDPTRRILDCAKSKKCDMMVLGSRGLGDVKGLLLGSVSHKVLQAAPCTCVVVH